MVTQAEKLEKQLRQQELDEMGLSGKLYGRQEPKITKTKAKGRKVAISAYMLATTISKLTKKTYVKIALADEEELAIDTITREVLYFNDKTGEESYLDEIVFSEQ